MYGRDCLDAMRSFLPQMSWGGLKGFVEIEALFMYILIVLKETILYLAFVGVDNRS